MIVLLAIRSAFGISQPDFNFDHIAFAVENVVPGMYIYNIVQDGHAVSKVKLNVIH